MKDLISFCCCVRNRRDGQTYVWVEGRYLPNREGHVWHPYVMERSGERWHFRAGHWDDD